MPVPGGIYTQWRAITPSDANNFAPIGDVLLSDCIQAGGAGVIAAVDQAGDVLNITVVAGEIVPGRWKRVNSTNTTATLLRAGYCF